MDDYTKPDYNRSALITIDVQNDFSLPGSPLEVKGTLDIIPNIVTLLDMFRRQEKLIIHIVRLYNEDGTNVDISRRKKIENGMRAVIPGSAGAELVRDLKPGESILDAKKLLRGDVQKIAANEFIMYKSRWGAFYKTALERFLRQRKISTLIFAGCNFPNCPRTSIYEASERDFKIVVVRDAISGVYEQGLDELKNIGCELLRIEDLMSLCTRQTGDIEQL
jgi:nicotinamidase-related amidase